MKKRPDHTIKARSDVRGMEEDFSASSLGLVFQEGDTCITQENGELCVCSTAHQDSVRMKGKEEEIERSAGTQGQVFFRER